MGGRTDLHRLEDARIVVLAAEHDDRRSRRPLVHPSNGLCPGGLGRHFDKDHVRRGGVDHGHRLVRPPDLGHDLDVGLAIEDLPDSDPEK
jgi:hypothetical protein